MTKRKITFKEIKQRNSLLINKEEVDEEIENTCTSNNECDVMKFNGKKLQIFDHRQMLFKDLFMKSELFKWSCRDPYEKIDHFYGTLRNLENEERILLQKAHLEELHFPEHLPLKIIKRELTQLKHLWDCFHLVKTDLHQLKKSRLSDLLLNQMEKQFTIYKMQLCKLEDIKECEAFHQLMSIINQTLNCIYSYSELGNPALAESFMESMVAALKEIETNRMLIMKSKMV